MKPQSTITTCPLDCFDGCSIVVGEDGVLKGDKNHPITQGYLCPKLNHYHEYNRISVPRFMGKEVGMDEALALLTQHLHTYAPVKTLLFRGSGNLGVMQGVTKRFFAQHGAVLASGSLCDGAGTEGVIQGRGANLALSALRVKHAEVVILWGRNPSVTNSHMLPSLRGKTLIVIDPIKTDLAQKADLYLQIKPAGDIYLAILLCRMLRMKQGEDISFIKNHCENYEAFLALIESIPMDILAQKADVKLEDARLLIDLIQEKKVSILVGIGVQKYSFGHSALRAIDALGAMLGLFGKEGCGVGYLSSSHFGFKMPFKVNAKTEPLPTCDFSKYDLVVIQGGNPLSQMPCTPKVKKALDAVSCIVYFGLHENETSQKAHLVIPALSFLEKEDVKLSYGHEFIGKMPRCFLNKQGISEYALTQHLLKKFGYETLEDEHDILESIVASNSVQKEGFLIAKTYEETPYKRGFYTPNKKFIFFDSFEDTLKDEGQFYLLSAKQKRGLNSQFTTDDYLYVPLCLGLSKDDRVSLSTADAICEYKVMPSAGLRDDCLLLHSGAKNANYLTPFLISQEGQCAIYQELKVTLKKLA